MVTYIRTDIKKAFAQAAGADSSQFNSTKMQNPSIQQIFCNFWANYASVIVIYNVL